MPFFCTPNVAAAHASFAADGTSAVIPYRNNDTITILSPTLDFSNVIGNVDVSYPLFGYIEDGWDFMTFDYFDQVVWVTDATYTGAASVLVTTTLTNTTMSGSLSLQKTILKSTCSCTVGALKMQPFSMETYQLEMRKSSLGDLVLMSRELKTIMSITITMTPRR
mgnify:CR=1 FL=1